MVFLFYYRVNLIKAEDLVDKDTFGESDPYATLKVGSCMAPKVTKTVRNTCNPKWFYTADFPIDMVKSPELKIEVFDHVPTIKLSLNKDLTPMY